MQAESRQRVRAEQAGRGCSPVVGSSPQDAALTAAAAGCSVGTGQLCLRLPAPQPAALPPRPGPAAAGGGTVAGTLCGARGLQPVSRGGTSVSCSPAEPSGGCGPHLANRSSSPALLLPCRPLPRDIPAAPGLRSVAGCGGRRRYTLPPEQGSILLRAHGAGTRPSRWRHVQRQRSAWKQ